MGDPKSSFRANWGNHKTSWDNLKRSLDDDNPDFALISVWAILEDEVSRKHSDGLRKVGEGRNKSICNMVSKNLGYDSVLQNQLISAMEKRNKVAHGNSTSVSWMDVDNVLKSAHGIYKLN